MKIPPAILVAAALSLLGSNAAAHSIDVRAQTRIDRILKRTPLIDGHNDLPWELRENHGSKVVGLASGTDRRASPLMTDIARMRGGRMGGQFWSVFITGTITGDEAIRTTIEQIDTARRIIASYPADLELAGNAADVVRIHRSGRIASMLGVEGGRQIGGSLAALRQFHALGARYMTLTHNQTTEWADSATDDPKHGGLSPFGVEVVAEMNRLGMLVDLSHVSVETMNDALEMSRAPVIFSHSDVYALNPHPRNVPDEVLRRLAGNGGLIMLTFVPQFLSPEFLAWSREYLAEEARLKSIFSFSKAQQKAGLEGWEVKNRRPQVDYSAVADHVEHAARVAGHDHVGIGADYDGITFTVPGLDSVDDYPKLFAELIRRGWSDANLAKLAGGNILRVLRRAEEVAASMEGQQASLAGPQQPN
jgi:membrane dipeptidase